MTAASQFMLTVTNVSAPLFVGEVLFVTVPGVEGEMTILAHHEPHVSILKKGNIVIETVSGMRTQIEIEKGVLEVSGNQATILM